MQNKTLASVSRTACNALRAEASTGSALGRMRVAGVSIGPALVILKCERIKEQGTPPTLAAMKHACPRVRDGGTGTLKRNKEGTSQIRSCRSHACQGSFISQFILPVLVPLSSYGRGRASESHPLASHWHSARVHALDTSTLVQQQHNTMKLLFF